MKFHVVLMGLLGILLAAVSTDAARGSNTSPGNTFGRGRQGRIAVNIRMTADTRVSQALAIINKDTQDGQWLLASSSNVPLLDRWRGEENANEAPSETMLVAIRQTAKNAGIEATDTVIRILDRRIHRDAELRRYRDMGLLRRDTSGQWQAAATAADEEGSMDLEFARLCAEAENADVSALTREIERQVCAEQAECPVPDPGAARTSSGNAKPSCCAPRP
ncbi:MAG: hypothetical protein AAB229_05985 [Candidatus Hydrogenedentota bacterium]|mgnify:CR=1 FL=1